MICKLYYRIPFSETDAMGIVHHCNHGLYFERGRVELLRLIGMPYADIITKGMHFPVTDLQISFKRPLKFDDVIVIETKIARLSRTRLHFDYRVFIEPELRESSLVAEGSGEKPLVTAATHHCCVNAQGRPIEMASDVLAHMRKYFSGELS